MPQFNPLPSAPQEYATDEESVFRRQVDSSLLAVYRELSDATTCQSGMASPSSKREAMIPGSSRIRVTWAKGGTSGLVPSDITNSATPIITGLDTIFIANTTTLSITDFLGGFDGDDLVVFRGSVSDLTIVHDLSKIRLSTSSNLSFSGSASFLSSLTLKRISGIWVETNRTVFS